MRIDNVLFEIDHLTAAMMGVLLELRRAALADGATLAWAFGSAALAAALLTLAGRWTRRPATEGGLLLALRWPLCAIVLLLVVLRQPATTTTRLVAIGLVLAGVLSAVGAGLLGIKRWYRRRASTPWQELPQQPDAIEQLKRRVGEEIARAKRNPGHAITVVAMRSLDGPSLRSRDAGDALQAQLAPALRPYDAFAEDDDGTLLVLLPGADLLNARAVVPRARWACATADPQRSCSDRYACGFASYPLSGSTVEELLQAAGSGMTVDGGSQPAWIHVS